MERFASMLNKLGLRGSSDDGDGKRSSQSTPRLKRHLVNPTGSSSGENIRRSMGGSLGSMEAYRIRNSQNEMRGPAIQEDPRQSLNRSWECERVLGLDRSWETERIKGMELVYRSVEKERERGRSKHLKKRKSDKRGRTEGAERRSRSRESERDRMIRLETERLHRMEAERIQRLEAQMEGEQGIEVIEEKKHRSRREKQEIARLQRQLRARQKVAENNMGNQVGFIAGHPLRASLPHSYHRSTKESLMRELERERMLRVDAEQRLREMTIESDGCKSRLQTLQHEFQRMEDMVRSLLQYKSKIEHLKQEKASLTINYEKSVQKYRNRIGDLEEENCILSAELKKAESQCANCQTCNKDLSYRVTRMGGNGAEENGDKAKLLLERLKQLEAENSALVLENETQRQQYEKCLDDIANQVVQALLTQKCLREECQRLQRRVIDLEHQNRQLHHMFHQRLRFASDSVLQSLAQKKLGERLQPETRNAGSATSSASNLSMNTQVMREQVLEGATALDPSCRVRNSRDSMESLQSLCSDYDYAAFEEFLGKPEMSSPPPWLRDRLFSSFSSPGGSERAVSPSYTDPLRLSPRPDSQQELRISKSESLPNGHVHKTGRSPEVMNGSDSFNDKSEHSVKCGHLPGITEASPEDVDVPDAKNDKREQVQIVEPVQTVSATKLVAATQTKQTLKSPTRKEQISVEGGGCSVASPCDDVRKVSPSTELPTYPTKSDGATVCHKIETEFPANNESPKMKHVGVIYHKNDIGATQLTVISQTNPDGNTSLISEGATAGNGPIKYVRKQTITVAPSAGLEVSPGQELLKLSDSFSERYLVISPSGLPHLRGTFQLDSDSDEMECTSRPLSHAFSMASTVSLSELLERELDELETPLDEDFSVRNLQIYSLDNHDLEDDESQLTSDNISQSVSGDLSEITDQSPDINGLSNEETDPKACVTSNAVDNPTQLNNQKSIKGANGMLSPSTTTANQLHNPPVKDSNILPERKVSNETAEAEKMKLEMNMEDSCTSEPHTDSSHSTVVQSTDSINLVSSIVDMTVDSEPPVSPQESTMNNHVSHKNVNGPISLVTQTNDLSSQSSGSDDGGNQLNNGQIEQQPNNSQPNSMSSLISGNNSISLSASNLLHSENGAASNSATNVVSSNKLNNVNRMSKSVNCEVKNVNKVTVGASKLSQSAVETTQVTQRLNNGLTSTEQELRSNCDSHVVVTVQNTEDAKLNNSDFTNSRSSSRTVDRQHNDLQDNATQQAEATQTDILNNVKFTPSSPRVAVQRPNSLELPRKKFIAHFLEDSDISSDEEGARESTPTPTNPELKNLPYKLKKRPNDSARDESTDKVSPTSLDSDWSDPHFAVYSVTSPSSASTSYSSQGKTPTPPSDYVEMDGHLISSIKFRPSSSRLPQSQSKVTLVSPKEGAVMESSISSSSPDSAMQHSFSSESSSGSGSSCASNGTGATRRDDGYSSNSTVSTVSLADIHHDLAVRSRSAMDVPPPSYSEATKRDSFCSVQSSSAIENSSMGRVRDIKAKFEGPSTSGSNYGKKLAPPPPPKPSREKIQAAQSKKSAPNSDLQSGQTGSAKPNTKAKLVSKLPKKLFNEIRNKCSGRSSSKSKCSSSNDCDDDRSTTTTSSARKCFQPNLQKSHSEPALCPPSCVREHRLRVFQKHLKCCLDEITDMVHRSTMNLECTSHPDSLQTEPLSALKAQLLADWSKLQRKSTNRRTYDLPQDMCMSIPFSSDDSRSSSVTQGQDRGEGQRSFHQERSIGEGAEVNPHRTLIKTQRAEGDGSECSSPMSPEEAELQMLLGLPYYNCLAVNVVIGDAELSALSSPASQCSTPASPSHQITPKSSDNNNCCLQDHSAKQASSTPSSPRHATDFSQSDFGPRLLGQSEESRSPSLSQSMPCDWKRQSSEEGEQVSPEISRKYGGCVPLRRSSRLPKKVDKAKVTSGGAVKNSSRDVLPPQDRAELLDKIVSKSDLWKGQGHGRLRKWVIDKDGIFRSPFARRPTLDLKNFYTRYDQPEKEAMASFSFLDDVDGSSFSRPGSRGHHRVSSRSRRGHSQGQSRLFRNLRKHKSKMASLMHRYDEQKSINVVANEWKERNRSPVVMATEIASKGSSTWNSSVAEEDFGGLSFSDSCFEEFLESDES